MFKVESYISPFLLGYIDKYVKLRQEDFQLSLWGGDAVLNKLDLRLDVLEGALQLPIIFKSGHIHELRLHVPWTKLGSEPVVITINTIECVVKLRDSAYNDSSSTKSGSSSQVQTTSPPKPKPIRSQEEEDLPPGYLQSLMNRIIHNVNIVVNNLILKFVDDDIVLSVNVKSAECYSVNKEWARAFIELSMPELVLRRVVDFHDLTICLDKRNASGKIDCYQDPLLYRCSLTCRLHMIYDSLHAKLPTFTKFNMLCEKLDLSLTDTQVPMFFRLVELCVAMYYGSIGLDDLDVDGSDDVGADAVMVQVPSSPGYDVEGQSWGSWAWSYVPALLPSGEYEDDELAEDYGGVRKKPEPAVMAIGVYINKASVVFKLSEHVRDSAYYGPQKVQFRPCLSLECEAIGLEVLLRGLSFFNVQFGISGMKIQGLGEAICGVKDLDQGIRDPSFVRSGVLLDTTVQHPHYHLSESLFDPGGAENLCDRPTFVFDSEERTQKYSEQYALNKFGAFWMDYLFTMEGVDVDTADKPNSSRSSQSNHSSCDNPDVKENSALRFLLGPTQLNICSSMVQRLHKFIHCSQQHQYEPYSKARPDDVDESGQPTDADVTRLEEYIPTRSYHWTIVRPTVCLMAADLPEYDVTKVKVTSRKHRKSTKSKSQDVPQPVRSQASHLPTLVLQADRLDFQITSAMYPKALVKVVSKLPAPSNNLVHHCHSHTYIKVFGLQAGLTAIDPERGMSPLQSILQPGCGVYYKRALLLPTYWKNQLQAKVEHVYELPQLTVNLTKPQLLLLSYLLLSWKQTHPSPDHLNNITLLDDIFKAKLAGVQPVLEMGLSGLEVKHCDTDAVTAVTGTLGSIQALILSKESEGSPVSPILYGPVDTSKVYNRELFSRRTINKQEVEIKQDLITFTFQIPKNPDLPQAPTTFLADILGLAVCCDPLIHSWINYTPVIRAAVTMAAVSKKNDKEAVLNNILLEATSPLKKGSETLSESTVTNPTDSQTRTQSLTQTSQHVVVPKLLAPTDSVAYTNTEDQLSEAQNTWGKMFSRLYPLVKMMHIQVEMKSLSVFLPENHISLSEPSMDIPGNLRRVMLSGSLPDMVIMSLPALKIHCSGHRTVSASQEIPIKAMEQSLAGEKLPWSVRVQDLSVYTVYNNSTTLSILDPVSLSATVAVTTKYSAPLSDSITALGLCIHVDMDTITAKCSKQQVELAFSLMVEYIGCVGRVTEGIDILTSLHEKGFKTADTLDVIPPSVATAPPLINPRGHMRKASSSALLDHGELGLATITETSDSVSRGDGSPRDGEDTEAVKLSLWVQWTLLKAVFKLYVTDENRELLLRGELEDLTTAVDVQDVFSKLRCKVGSFAVRHFIKRHGAWNPGTYNGLILSSMDQLSRNIPMATNKIWTNQDEASKQMFLPDDPKLPDSTQGFMTLTFTRALQKNVQKKLLKSTEGMVHRMKYDDDTEEGSKKACADVYMNELCLNIQPCDVTLNCPVLAAILDIATLDGFNGSTKNVKTDGEYKTSSLPVLTSSKLPLLYINLGHLRVLMPNCLLPKHDLTSSSQSDQIQMTPESSVGNMNISLQDSDMFVLQIASVSLKPHADNPLSRTVLDKTVYEQALHAGITTQPGSDVEDRQYQADIHGLSLCSGSWTELLSLTRAHTAITKDPNVQNPALEWNTLDSNTSGDIEEMKLIPVAASFDLRVVAAPAIVYTPRDLQESQPLLVCGYSLEVNATTDMDYCMSINQIELLHQIYKHNISSLLSPVSPVSANHSTQLQPGLNQSELSMDSGVESEVSTLKSLKMRAKKTNRSAPVMPFDWSSVTPFDCLLTAGKISFMLYGVEERQPEIQIIDIGSGAGGFHNVKTLHVPMIVPLLPAPVGTTNLSASNLTSTNLLSADKSPRNLLSTDKKSANISSTDRNLTYVSSTEKSSAKLLSPDRLTNPMSPNKNTSKRPLTHAHLSTNCIRPFLYVYFSQPHSLVSCSRESQKAELSCFDIMVKGAGVDHVVEDSGRVVPEAADYSVHWIETRPGRSDLKTGIPPSLYTLRVNDMLNGPAKLDLCIERPLKVNLSTTKLDQMISFYDTLSRTMYPDKQTDAPQVVISGLRLTDPQTDKSADPAFLKVMTWAGDLHLHIDQILVVLETTLESNLCAVQMGVAKIDSDMTLLQHDKDYIQEMSCTTHIKDLVVKTTYMGHSRPLIGPLSLQVTVGLQWLPHSGAPSLPQTLVFAQCGLVQIHFGQEHFLCLEVIADSIQRFLHRFSSEESVCTKRTQPVELKSKVRHRSTSDIERSVDDLRTGAFVFVSDDMGVDLLPAANEVVFGVDCEVGQATMTWCYPRPRVVISLRVTPVPFTLPLQVDINYVDENLRIPCVLQYWDVLGRRFENYCEFSLSENDHTDVSLPEITADFSPDLVISGVWRILILHPDSDKPVIGTEDLVLEPLISPMSLAASVKVDSAFVPSYIPMIQCSIMSSLIQLRLSNHFQHLGQKPPSGLHPYHLDETNPRDHEYAVISVDQPNLSLTNIHGKQHRWKINASGSLQCDLLEYRSLTMQPVLEPARISLNVGWLQGEQWEKIQLDMMIEEMFLRISQGMVHTASTAVLAWKQLKKPDSERIIPYYFTICNDTQQVIRFGQADTEESIVIKSREAHAYSWRSHKEKQMLQVCTEELGWCWSDPICIDNEGTITRTIETSDNRATLIIRIKQMTNCQKQVTISGQLMIASRLTRRLDIRLLATTLTTETTSTLKAMETLPSYILEHDQVRAIKLKLEGSKTVWSQEIPVTGTTVNESRLVKLPLHDKKGYIHIWCHIFCQHHKKAAQNLVVFTPLFVVRTQLPTALLMNIETPRLKHSHQVALDGRGLEQQLHTMGGDMTHSLTFQLSPMMKPSTPAITLSSGLIDQVQCEAIGKPEINDLMYKWRNTDRPVWPYNTDTASSLTTPSELQYKPEQDIIIAQNYYPISKHTTTLPRGQNYPTHQPNIDLQINLSQLWPGCNTLLIDVVPYWMMDNQSGADLVLIGQERHGNEEKQWKVNQGQMFAPPVMEGAFKLGIMWGYILHQSSPITLSDEDDRSRYLPNAPDLLYLHGSLCVTIPLVKDGMINKICYLTLHSTMQHGMRTLTTRERYCLTNMTRWPLDCMCVSLTLSMNKIDIHGERFSSHLIGCSGDDPKVKDTGQQTANHELPLLLWDIPISESSLADFVKPSGKQTEHVQYMTLRQSQGHEHEGHQTQWSHPVRLKVAEHGSRQTVALPYSPDGSASPLETRACTLTTQSHNSIIHVIVLEDKRPPILIHNNCHLSLHVGQTLAVTSIPGIEIQEQAELTTSLHTVPAHGSYHYALPSNNTQYPDISKTQSSWKLHFCATYTQNLQTAAGEGSEVKGEEVKKVICWSSGVDLESQHDTFVSVPNAVDAKVHVERVGHTYHVFIDPVSRAEISAKEIRSRIKGREVVVIEAGSQRSPSRHSPGGSDHDRRHSPGGSDHDHRYSPGGTDNNRTLSPGGTTDDLKHSPGGSGHHHTQTDARSCIPESDVDMSSHHSTAQADFIRSESRSKSSGDVSERGSQNPPSVITETQSNVKLNKLSITLVDDIVSSGHISEVLRVTACDMVVVLTPEDITKALTSRHTHFMQRLMCGVGHVQIDNQVYGKGNYDFPVIFVPQKGSDDRPQFMAFESFLKLPKFDKWKEIKKKSVSYATLQLCEDVIDHQRDVTRFSLATEPLSVYLEDVFVYDLLKYMDRLIPTSLVRSTAHNQPPRGRIPAHAHCMALIMNSPMRLHRLSIEPVSLLISVHASLKLFIASDNTPLRFGQFERINVFTNPSQLIRTLVMHYASGALFRAGWVVGSLEILGSPTGLIRSLGNGVSDLFRLPYEGFTQGPGAFVGGVTRGMGSLLRHVSTGTLTSITNFASSVSRNMEKLSLDGEYCERQEEGRRHKPDGLSQGLKNGLTGFGLSLLGAVAGIADQPLQTFSRPGDIDQPRSTSQAATGIVSGVGKGLVGMVTKPLGGAAELVSQTGMGLLQGTGLSRFPQQQREAVDEHIGIFPNGTVKFILKMLQLVPKCDVLFISAASQINTRCDDHQVVLVLTREVLFIVDEVQDVQQQAFTITELECVEETWDPQLVRIIVKDGKKSATRWNGSQLTNSERVAEFIDKTAQYRPIASHNTEQDPQYQPIAGHDTEQDLISCEEPKESDKMEPTRHDNGISQSDLRKKSEKQSESPSRRSRKKKLLINSFDFQLDSRHKDMFIAMFNIATDRMAGYGFPL